MPSMPLIFTFLHIIGILHGYTIGSGRRPSGSERPQGSIPFIQYKCIVNTTKVKLWNYKSNDLPANGLPTLAWSHQPSHQLDKVSEGRRPEHLLNNPGLYITYNCAPQYIWGYFAEIWNKSHWFLQRIYRLTVCNHHAFVLSRSCRVSRSRPHVFHETIMVISLWHHNNGLWNNAESIAAHNNAIPRTMGCITI